MINNDALQVNDRYKKAKNILAVLLSVVVLVCIILGYLLFNAANRYKASEMELVQELSSMESEINDLEFELNVYKAVAKEYDNHAVIVVPEVDNYYHRVGCSRLPESYTFFAYNSEAAVGAGYSRCPECFNRDFDDYIESNFLGKDSVNGED